MKVLAISSGGGHWVQLQRVVPAFSEHEVVFATVNESYREDAGERRFYLIPDATRWDRLGLIKLAWSVARIVLSERPDIVISTGAAPGFFAIVLARLLGAKTIWLDSIANIERLSMSGRLVRPFAGLWLTQWAGLARPEGPECAGRVF